LLKEPIPPRLSAFGVPAFAGMTTAKARPANAVRTGAKTLRE